MCGMDGSSNGGVEAEVGISAGVFDHGFSSQKTRTVHARGSKLDFEDKKEESMAT